MDYENESRKKVEGFRKRLRRQQLDNYFAEQREKIIEARERELTDALEENVEKQKEILQKYSLELTGEPKQEWQGVISSLNSILLGFQGEFQYWFTYNIIKSLCNALHRTNYDLKLGPSICALFSDMLCLSSQHETHFGQKLMEYEILSDVIQLGCEPSYSIYDRLTAMMFCANIINCNPQLYRVQAIRNGAGVMAILMGEHLLKWQVEQENICQKYLYVGNVLLTAPRVGEKFNTNLVSKMIPIAAEFVFRSSSPRVLCQSLKMLNEALRHDKHLIYMTIKNCNKLITTVLSLLTSSSPEVRTNAILLISTYTYCQDPQIPMELISFDILDRLSQACTMTPKTISYFRSLIFLLSNIAVDSKNIANFIYEHKIFQVFLDLIKDPQYDKIKGDTFFCLTTIIELLYPNNFMALVQKQDILNNLVVGLKEYRYCDSEATAEILNALTIMAQKGNQTYQAGGNFVINQLQNTYRLTNILDDMIRTPNNPFVSKQADELHKVITDYCWGEIDRVI